MSRITSSVRRLGRTPVLGPVLMGVYRSSIAARYLARPLRHVPQWLAQSSEYTNFTYDLTATNKRYLAAFVAQATGIPRPTVAQYIAEIDEDAALRAHIVSATQASVERAFSDDTGFLAKRLGWYALARITKPRIVVETGVEKGLGACVMATALSRNAAEGSPGHYYGTDIQPRAGYLFTEPYNKVGEILYGDSIESLRGLDETVDLFINDSDHSAEYEAAEYQTIKSKLSDRAWIIGDNAHVTDNLLNFADANGWAFSFFAEEPANHWYPGGGIGLAWRAHP
ncbi:MAG: class I SAM-dependent methyltransferase [Bacteroidota bacterium]